MPSRFGRSASCAVGRFGRGRGFRRALHRRRANARVGSQAPATASGFCFGRTCTHKLCVLGPEGTCVGAANQPAPAVRTACTTVPTVAVVPTVVVPAVVVPTGVHRGLHASLSVSVRVARIDPATSISAGSGRPALPKGRELAVAWIAPAGTLKAVASRGGGGERSDRGQEQNGGESSEHKSAHGRSSTLWVLMLNVAHTEMFLAIWGNQAFVQSGQNLDKSVSSHSHKSCQRARNTLIAITLMMSTKKAETSGRMMKAFGDGP